MKKIAGLQVNENINLIIPTLDLSHEIYGLIDNDRDHLSQWLSWVPKVQSYTDVEQNLRERIQGYQTGTSASFYAVYNNVIVASVGFISINNNDKKGEIGYWISSQYQGKGIVSKSVKACINYGFNRLGLNKIIIQCARGNSRSINLAGKLGFSIEGILKEDRIRNNTYHDTFYFSLFKKEYKG
jgi:ribosomal-protein-serine acetyltransferase